MIDVAVLEKKIAHDMAPDLLLSEFHDAHPGATVSMMSGLLSVQGLSSYELVAKAVAAYLRPNEVVLDLACGDGYLLDSIRSLSTHCHLTGVDFSSGELRAARLRLGSLPRLINGDVRSLPLSSESVDVAVSHMALMLINPIDKVLREVVRVLRPQGRFFALMPTAAHKSEALQAFFQCLSVACAEEEISLMRFGTNIRCARDWLGILRDSAPELTSIRVREIVLHAESTPLEIWNRLQNFYDVFRLSARGRETLKARFLTMQCQSANAHGLVDFAFPVHVVMGEKRGER